MKARMSGDAVLAGRRGVLDEAAEQEVQLAQAHEREHVRGEDEERAPA